MNKTICFIVLTTLLFAHTGWSQDIGSIKSISIDFPHGETRLLVQRNGEAFLFYGALPRHKIVRKGTFDIEELFRQLQPRVHLNVPREEWPNPKGEAGMVTFRFADKSEENYLVFDGAFAEDLFNKARNNIVGQRP